MDSAPHARIRRQLAQQMAQFMADHGLEPGAARKRALDMLAEGQRLPQSALPDANDIDQALFEHLELFDPKHGTRVRRMREVALAMMRRLMPTPVLATGAVWKGIATQDAPIHLQAFPEDEKQLHFQLLDLGLDPEALQLRHFRSAKPVDALGVHWQGEAIMIAIYQPLDFRGALLPNASGSSQSAERGDLQALENKLKAQIEALDSDTKC